MEELESQVAKLEAQQSELEEALNFSGKERKAGKGCQYLPDKGLDKGHRVL